MLASLSSNSFKQYDSCLKKWFQFCIQNNLNLFQPSISNILNFLTELYNNGAQYGTINSCRSALSLLLGPQISNNETMKRFFKGIFRLRPPMPKYNLTWDTSLVLNHIADLYPNDSLDLETISKKLITLLALVTAHRMQTLSMINIKNIEWFPDRVIIKIPDLIKTSRLNSTQPALILPYFQSKPEICVVNTLKDFLILTEPLRNNHSYLFVSLRNPHHKVTSQTLSRWVKSTLEVCGIDVATFTAHSTRHASTSKANRLGVNLDLIRKTAGWSASSKTFIKFYNRDIVNELDYGVFANAIMSRQENL